MKHRPKHIHGLSKRDSLLLAAYIAVSWTASFALLSVATPFALRSVVLESIGKNLTNQALHLNSTDQQRPRFTAVSGYTRLRIQKSVTPPAKSLASIGEDGQIIKEMLSNSGINGTLRRAPGTMTNWPGGYWLSVKINSDRQQVAWVYASAESSMTWLWPFIRISSAFAGSCLGITAFLRMQVEMPVRRALIALPEIPNGSMELIPEDGISPMKELCIRINRLLEQINEHDRDRSLFLQGLAHDIGTPLTHLSLYIESLQDDAYASEGNIALQKSYTEIERLSSLIHLLQEASATNSEPFRANIHALDELCERIVESYREEKIRVETSRTLVRIDYKLVERAVQNLIDNALKHGSLPILLSVRKEQGYAIITVEDSGSGITSPNTLKMPYIQPYDDRQHQKRTCLGLSIVQRCCELHGGRLKLQNSNQGGLKAEIHLPVKRN